MPNLVKADRSSLLYLVGDDFLFIPLPIEAGPLPFLYLVEAKNLTPPTPSTW